jgi:CheY-like chemotaxis protein
LRALAESTLAPSGAAILLVEDDADLAGMFGLGLLSADHVVRVAGDGSNAIESARRERFDLVLLDVQLPRIDGSRPSPSFEPVGPLEICRWRC